ncbi:hypothetical protein EV217_5075 [Phyllobacterium myrsinacearum]|nr:hypothetical protein EV217_5075 [Phyllobacterium myrsinacearum]
MTPPDTFEAGRDEDPPGRLRRLTNRVLARARPIRAFAREALRQMRGGRSGDHAAAASGPGSVPSNAVSRPAEPATENLSGERIEPLPSYEEASTAPRNPPGYDNAYLTGNSALSPSPAAPKSQWARSHSMNDPTPSAGINGGNDTPAGLLPTYAEATGENYQADGFRPRSTGSAQTAAETGNKQQEQDRNGKERLDNRPRSRGDGRG